jgi:hypothetical protein
MSDVIDIPTETVVVRRESGPLSVVQVSAALKLIHDVMRECMEEGKDYGKVPGCGEKPGLFQPGAQKLSMMFQLNPEVKDEVISDYPNFHRGYRLVVRVTNGPKFADGVGECSTMESKYRFRNGSLVCPECGKESVLKSKNPGEGWFCWSKKGGCGAKFATDDESISKQNVGKVENENPADHWNTCRKMAFKRAFVHAIINATNTSELWSQDLEDLAGNGVVAAPERSEAPKTPPAPKSALQRQPEANTPLSGDEIHRIQAVFFASYDVKTGRTKAGKPWRLFICRFDFETGPGIECSTFSDSIGKNLDVLKGLNVRIAYKPGRKEGTLELVSIEPDTDAGENMPPF